MMTRSVSALAIHARVNLAGHADRTLALVKSPLVSFGDRVNRRADPLRSTLCLCWWPALLLVNF